VSSCEQAREIIHEVNFAIWRFDDSAFQDIIAPRHICGHCTGIFGELELPHGLAGTLIFDSDEVIAVAGDPAPPVLTVKGTPGSFHSALA
jgi:hypothetical protein